MTKFDSNMERDINRCAVALEKLTKLVTLQQEVIELLSAEKIKEKIERNDHFEKRSAQKLEEWEVRELETVRARMEAKDKAKQTAKARRRKKNET